MQQPAAATQQQHRPLARPVLLLRSSNTVRWRDRPLVLTDRQTNKHPGMTIMLTIRDAIPPFLPVASLPLILYWHILESQSVRNFIT